MQTLYKRFNTKHTHDIRMTQEECGIAPAGRRVSSFRRTQQTCCVQSKYTISGTAHRPRAGGARDCGRHASSFLQRPGPSEGPCHPRPLLQHSRSLPRHRLQRPPASRRFVTSSVCSRLRSKSVFSLCSGLAHLRALIALARSLSFFTHSTVCNIHPKKAQL